MSGFSLPSGVDIRHPDRLYVDGAWQASSCVDPIDIISPDTEQVVARVAQAGTADVDAAVNAARAAFDNGPWRHTSPSERSATLLRFAEVLRRREPEIAKAWTAQIGGLASIAPGMAAGGTRKLEAIARLAKGFAFVRQVESNVAACAILSREPVGVVAAIAPWNGPYPIMIGKVAAALAAGCSVIMKPAPETPLEAYIIAEAAEEIGLPAGTVNLVCADRAASDHLVNSPGIDKVSFTGSTEVGRRIASVCGGRMARYTMELGGKSAALILDDYPLAQAGKILARTITALSGQICAMTSRAIVSRSRHDELVDYIVAEMRSIRVGRSDHPASEMGPVAMRRQLDRIQSYIAGARAQGIALATGGNRPAHLDRGFFIEPTLFAGVDNRSQIAQEEIFGPVLCLIPSDGEDDAIRIANQSDYGLNGAVFTTDPARAWHVARSVHTGSIAQNGLRLDLDLPFGGVKQSGVGREGGEDGLMAYLETKTILLDASPVEHVGGVRLAS